MGITQSELCSGMVISPHQWTDSSPNSSPKYLWKKGVFLKSNTVLTPQALQYFPEGITFDVMDDPEFVQEIRDKIRYTSLKAGMPVMCGMDPEVFAVDERGDVIPAFEFLPSKTAPLLVHHIGEREYLDKPPCQVFYDGFQAEFTILPEGCHGFMTDYVRIGLAKVWEQAKTRNPRARLTSDSVVYIPREQRMAVDPQYLALGCAPSKNAYGEPPLAVPAPEELETRFAGAHMHFGFESYYHPKSVKMVVQFLDAVVGVALVGMGEGYTNPDRRRYYGRAGEYRYHPAKASITNRLEWRVPDTLLLAHPATFNAVWDLTRVVLRMALEGLEWLWVSDPDEVRRAINEGDVKLARKILNQNLNVFRRMVEKANPNWGCTMPVWLAATEKLFFGGIGEVVREPRDLIENWWLERPTVAPILDTQAKEEGVPMDSWISESYGRKPEYWPTGRIWSHAAMVVEKGGKV